MSPYIMQDGTLPLQRPDLSTCSCFFASSGPLSWCAYWVVDMFHAAGVPLRSKYLHCDGCCCVLEYMHERRLDTTREMVVQAAKAHFPVYWKMHPAHTTQARSRQQQNTAQRRENT